MADEKKLSKDEIEALFKHNAAELNKMQVSAGAVISQIVHMLEDNGPAYLKLRDAEAGGHKIHYDWLEGDRTMVPKIAKILGLKQCTDDLLEVQGGR